MDFISLSVFGVLCMLAEFASGSLYLLGIGLAFFYAAAANYLGAPTALQLGLLGGGSIFHGLLLWRLRQRHPDSATVTGPEIGEQVEIIEWLDELSARVRYQGQEWQADKADGRMPNATHGTIHAIQGSRLIITTTG